MEYSVLLLSLEIVYLILNKQLRIVSSISKRVAKEIVLGKIHYRRRNFFRKRSVKRHCCASIGHDRH